MGKRYEITVFRSENPTIIASYFECSLSTRAAVLTAKHQQGLHSQNGVLLQLYYIWEKVINLTLVNISEYKWGKMKMKYDEQIGLKELTFFWTGNGNVGEHYDPMSSHCQVTVVTAFLCQFNQVSEPRGNRRTTWEEWFTERISLELLLFTQDMLHNWKHTSKMNTTCHVAEVLFDCNCSREGGEDSQHPQLQTVIRAGQGTLTQSLQAWTHSHYPHFLIKSTIMCIFFIFTWVFSLIQRWGAFLASSFRSLIASLFTAFLGSSFRYWRRSCNCTD